MPISDYASAFFFARRNRVTLLGFQTEPRCRDCNFQSVPRVAAIDIIAALRSGSLRSWRCRVPDLLLPAWRDTGWRETLPRSGGRDATSKEKARRSRALDEYISRLVYFASFAI